MHQKQLVTAMFADLDPPQRGADVAALPRFRGVTLRQMAWHHTPRTSPPPIQRESFMSTFSDALVVAADSALRTLFDELAFMLPAGSFATAVLREMPAALRSGDC